MVLVWFICWQNTLLNVFVLSALIPSIFPLICVLICSLLGCSMVDSFCIAPYPLRITYIMRLDHINGLHGLLIYLTALIKSMPQQFITTRAIYGIVSLTSAWARMPKGRLPRIITVTKFPTVPVNVYQVTVYILNKISVYSHQFSSSVGCNPLIWSSLLFIGV